MSLMNERRSPLFRFLGNLINQTTFLLLDSSFPCQSYACYAAHKLFRDIYQNLNQMMMMMMMVVVVLVVMMTMMTMNLIR